MTVGEAEARWGALPTKVLTIDLEDGLHDVTGLDGYTFVLALVRFAGEPVGSIRVAVEGSTCPGSSLADAVLAELGERLVRTVLLTALETSKPGSRLDLDDVTLEARSIALNPGRSLTAAVCTRDRPAQLRRCLESLVSQRSPVDILVVDNAPSSDASARLVAEQFPEVSYIVEPRPGLDHARNRAIDSSSTELLAFTDDDAVADERWTAAVIGAFDEEPELSMVTGLVLPLELETPAQHIFERLGGFDRGVTRRWISVRPEDAGRRLGTGELGTGANMGFRRSALRQVGGFDPSLDVGTVTGGGGDHDVFHRILAAGMLVRYEPAAMVFHQHRRSMGELREQTSNNGAVWSMMTAARLAGRADGRDVARVLRWYATDHWPRRLLHAWLVPNRVPVALSTAEMKGFVTAALRNTYRQSLAVNGLGNPVTSAASTPTRSASDQSSDGSIAVVAADVTDPPPPGLGVVETVVILTRGARAIGRLRVPARGRPLSHRAWREMVVDECGIDVLATRDTRSRDEVSAETVARLRTELRRRTEPSIDGSAPCSASIVIATLDRPDELAESLRLVADHATRHPFEVIVVDNNPASGLTPPVLDRFPDVVRVDESRRGLAYARNAGIRRSTGDIVVTTDDDVRVPVGWLDLLLDPFRRNDVMAVCGNVQPLELRTQAQIDFETVSPLSKGFRRFESRWEHPSRPWTAFPAWELGATANAAFRRTVFEDDEIGLMDEALGPGMPSGVGEDSYLLYRIVRAGYTVLYEPDAYVWHRHRTGAAALSTQITNYYSGHVAHQLTTLIRDRDPRAVHRLARTTAYVTVSRLQALVGRGPVPAPIARAQLGGVLRGPRNYVRSHMRVRRECRGGGESEA